MFLRLVSGIIGDYKAQSATSHALDRSNDGSCCGAFQQSGHGSPWATVGLPLIDMACRRECHGLP